MNRSLFLSAALAGLVALVGCANNEDASSADDEALHSSTPAGGACTPLAPRTVPLEVFAQPDCGVEPFVETLGRATKTIDFMVYQMGTGHILDTIIAKAQVGVKVRAILDLAQKPVNEKYKEKMEAASPNITVIWSDPKFAFMHAKFMVVDGTEAIVGTGNYYEKLMLQERNYATRVKDPADLASLNAIFEADFNRQTPDLSCTRLLVAPVNARQRLLDLINSATKSITVESMQFQDAEIRAAIVAKKNKGIDVRIILAEASWITANTGAATYLQSNGIAPKSYPHAHVKNIVVDGNKAYVGSINLSTNSMNKNREVGLIVTEQNNVDLIVSTFEHDWTTGTPFPTTPTPTPAPAASAEMEDSLDVDDE
jgi:phosphatidylserine/phosphatidylglycerophosphate/cardiolipin synthase-like enzyme